MELTNKELYLMNYAVTDLVSQKMKGRVKFKFYKLAKELGEALIPVNKAMEEAETEKEKEEIGEETQEMNLPTFTYEELEPIEMSAEQLFLLNKLIEEEE